MNKLELLNHETVITEANDKTIRLTSHRIIHYKDGYTESKLVSITLEKISSIEVHYKSWLLLLILGILTILAGLMAGAQRHEDVMKLGLVVGVGLILAYLGSRKHLLTISSDGGAKIHIETRGMKREAIWRFINQVDAAKDERWRVGV